MIGDVVIAFYIFTPPVYVTFAVEMMHVFMID